MLQLHDRDVGLGKRVDQHRPGAVVDAPAVDIGADPGGVDHVAHLVGQLGQARRRVLDVEQRLREPVEVVDRPRPRHGGDGGGVDVPVRR